MHLLDITDHHSRVQAERAARRARFAAATAQLNHWLTVDAQELALHDVVDELTTRLKQVALAALALWAVLRLVDDDVPGVLTQASGSYRFHAWQQEPVRTHFGDFNSFEPVYLRSHGNGPKYLTPHSRRLGLAPGRMSLGVHLLVANLAARMTFKAVGEVAKAFNVWVPGRRAMLGIVDLVGQHAVATLQRPVAPDPLTEGTHVVIEQDDGGIPHVRPEELAKRRQPNRRRTRGRRTRREQRRERRGRREQRQRRRTGDKSKNCRMATVYVVYTLAVHDDGTVEGPLNRQVFASTGNKEKLRTTVKRAAKARGWGRKPSIYLADGASTHWKAWQSVFHEGTPCVDWYHVAEYLWQAAEAVYRVTSPKPKGRRAKKAYNAKKKSVTKARSAWVRRRQDELFAGKIDAVEQSLKALAGQIGATGPGTRTRRAKVQSALTYMQNHRDFLNYAKVGDIVMGTGVVESTIKQLGARLKGPGMRWSVERAERVLALRCLQLSEDGAWARLTERVRVAHEACTSLHVPPVSPTQVLTGHRAVRKAA